MINEDGYEVIKVEIPKGYVIDKDKSDFEKGEIVVIPDEFSWEVALKQWFGKDNFKMNETEEFMRGMP